MNFFRKIWIMIVVSLLAIEQPGKAQSSIPNVEVISSENGLSQVSIQCILQDSRGFLWIGTQDGLNLYNGISITVFQQNPNDTSSLVNNFVKAMAEDSKGNIWVGTLNGLCMFDRQREIFVNYFAHMNPSPFEGDQNIFSLYIDRAGIVWFKTLDYLFGFDPVTHKLERYRHFRNLLNSFSDLVTFPMLEDHAGRFWVGTIDGLNLFDRGKASFLRFSHEPENPRSISDNDITAIFEDNQGSLWIGTENGLNLFDPNTETFQQIFLSNSTLPASNGIKSIVQGEANTLWVATSNTLYRINKGSLQLEAITEVNNHNEIHPLDLLSTMYMDKSGILWIGFQQGMIKFDTKPRKFELYRKNYRGIPNFASNDIGALFEDDLGQIWIGTWEKGLDIYNRATQQVVHYDAMSRDRRFRISNNSVHLIFRDRNGTVFLGTNDGLEVYDPVSKTFTSFCKASNAASCSFTRRNRKYAMIEDRNGNYWLGTESGLHLYDARYGIFRSYYTLTIDSQQHDLTTVNSILEDRKGYIWIGTNNGLIRHNPNTSEFVMYTRQEGKENTLSSNSVYYLYEDHRGILWVGTGAGLNRFDQSTGKFKVYTVQNGLPNNVIYAIVEDRKGNLWMSTNRGITKFDPLKEEFTTFDLSDGLQNYEFNLAVVFKSLSGEIFFGGINGFNSFYPDSIKRNNHIPSVQITNFELITPKGLKKQLFHGKQEIIIPYNSRNFSIEYAALDFTDPLRNKYAYKLEREGEEAGWISAGNRTFASYNDVAPGDYVFKVKGSNSDNVWNEDPTELIIHVKSPFYTTRTYYFIYTILMVLIIFWFIRWRTARLRKDNRILREKQQAAIKIARQKEELTIKNKNITDSLNYAKRIQQALMPSETGFKKILPVSFVLHRPKDIVSGDFYWISENGNRIFVAAIDCTGHGVPGAFMSIIGYELFRRITHSPVKSSSDEILNILNAEFANIFSGVESMSLKDGMDIALCIIDRESADLSFSGAFNPLYIIREDKIIELKGDRFSVGLEEEDHQHGFTSQTIRLEKNDMVYMFSDGYADQFGGPDGKKFKYRRFRHILLNIHHFAMEEQKQLLDQTIDNWRGNMEQIDDILVLGFRPEIGN